jgi:ketosteroid isomerase-like protein
METITNLISNTGIVQQCYADFGSGNTEGIMNALADDIVWIDPGHVGKIYKGKRNGKAEIADFFNILPQEITMTKFDVFSFSEAGKKVFVEGHLEATANVTRKTVSLDWLMVWEVENSKVIYHRLFLDTKALAETLEG